MFELKVITDFAAAHQLRMVGEKCENLHGHNWKVEVFVTGETLNEAGDGIYQADRVADLLRRCLRILREVQGCCARNVGRGCGSA